MNGLLRKTIHQAGSLIFGAQEQEAIRNRVVSGAGGLIALRIAFSALSFAGTVVLARVLGAPAYGEYSYALAWVVLLGIPAILGADQLLVREAASSLARLDWSGLRGVVRAANLAVLASSALIALLAAGAAWLFAPHWTTRTLHTFWIALALLPVIALTRVRQGAMQGLHRVALGALPEQLIQPALFLVFLAAVWTAGRGIEAPAAMGVHVLSASVAFAVGMRLLLLSLPAGARAASPEYRLNDWAPSAMRLMFVASANVLCGQADTLILGSLKGAEAVGTYAISHRGADFITFIQQAQNSALASTIASLYASRDMQRLQSVVTKLSRWMVLGAMPLAILMIVFGDLFLRFYGAQFAPARTTLAIMGIGQFLNVCFGPAILLLTMTGNESSAARAIGFGAVANILLTFTLVPRWGAEGAAVAYTLSMMIWNLWMAIAIYRRTGLHSTSLGMLTRRG